MVVHQFVAARYAMKGVFRCNMDKTITTKVAQSLSGRLHNGIISGGTGSGKTTLLKAFLDHIPQEERLLVIEQPAEPAPVLRQVN